MRKKVKFCEVRFMLSDDPPPRPLAEDAAGAETGEAVTLDAFDIRLLAAIQADGGLTQAELSDRVNLSATQCARRLDRLKKEGYVRGTVALLDPEKLGFHVATHTLVSLRDHTAEGNALFQRFIQDSPEILECYSQTGTADYLLRTVTIDLDHLSRFLDRLIQTTGGLASVTSSVVLKTIKKTTALPLQILS